MEIYKRGKDFKRFWGPCKEHNKLIYDKDTGYYYCEECGLYIIENQCNMNFKPKKSLLQIYIESELEKYQIDKFTRIQTGDEFKINLIYGNIIDSIEIPDKNILPTKDIINTLKPLIKRTYDYYLECGGIK